MSRNEVSKGKVRQERGRGWSGIGQEGGCQGLIQPRRDGRGLSFGCRRRDQNLGRE